MVTIPTVAVDDHNVSAVKKAWQLDLRKVVGDQKTKRQENKDNAVRSGLKTAAKQLEARQALLSLVVRHGLILAIPKWPEVSTFIRALNYIATGIAWDSNHDLS